MTSQGNDSRKTVKTSRLNPPGPQAALTDISDRKQVEQRLRHLNSVLQAYTLVNEVIVKARGQKQMLEDICQALVSTRGYYNAWIILLDKESKVADQAQAGLGEEFQEMLSRFQSSSMPSCALKALSSPLPRIIADPPGECGDCPLAQNYSGRSGFSSRLEVDGFILGLLTVSVPRELALEKDEVDLFTSLSGSIAQGIQRIRLENIRRAQRSRLKNYERIISRVREPMSLVDQEYRYVIVNEAYLKEFGKTREEIEGHTVAGLLGTDIFENKVKPRLDAAFAGQEVAYEDSFTGRDGTARHLAINYYPYHGKDGTVSGVVATTRDITQRKNTEEALRESENLLRTLIDTVGEGIVLKDGSDRFVHWNRTASETFGLGIDKALGQTPEVFRLEFIREDGTPYTGRDFPSQYTLRTGKPCDNVIMGVRRGDEDVSWIKINTRPIFKSESEKPFLVVVSFSNITRIKQAQEKISRINEQLHRALEERDMFSSIIAHDLKSPMSGLLSLSKMLADDPGSLAENNLPAIFQEMYKSAHSVYALLEDLLQWSRIRRNVMEFAPESCPLDGLIQMSLQSAATFAGQKDVKLSSEVPSGVNVLVDRPMISTVIRNLIFNAIKFSHRGGQVLVSAMHQGQFARVCVRDEGIGMDSSFMSRVFSIDKTARQTGTEGEKGTGMGLILCRELVEKHGGQIWLESESGKGTEVCFTLPAG